VEAVKEIDAKRLWTVYYVYLLSSIPVFSWYDHTALSALTNPSTDSAGNLVFSAGGVTVYPFTIASSLFGMVLTAFLVWRRVGGLKGALLGALIGRASIAAISELYELTFVSIGYLAYGWRALVEHFLPNLGWTAVKAGYVSALLPWIRRDGFMLAIASVSLALLAFALWGLTGYKLPESGDATGYAFNAVTRSLYCMTPALALMDRSRFSRRM